MPLPLFTYVLGIQTGVLTVKQRTLNSPSPLPNPMITILKCIIQYFTRVQVMHAHFHHLCSFPKRNSASLLSPSPRLLPSLLLSPREQEKQVGVALQKATLATSLKTSSRSWDRKQAQPVPREQGGLVRPGVDEKGSEGAPQSAWLVVKVRGHPWD